MAQPSLMAEFAPLLKAARPTVYQLNGFRLIGVAVDAEASEINRQIQKIELMQKFGGTGQQVPMIVLPPPSAPSAAALQDAKQRLIDPQSRLIEEFFWFWPEQPRGWKSDLAIQALQRADSQSAIDIWTARAKKSTDTSSVHNLAIIFHCQALDSVNAANNGNVPEALWIRAWKYWRMLVEHDPFWERLAARIDELDDPRLSSRTASQIRSSVCSAILQIDLSLAIAAAEGGEFARTGTYLRIARESGFDIDVIRHRTEQALTHVRSAIHSLCENAESKLSSNVEQTPFVLRQLVADVKPKLELLNYSVGAGSRLRDSAHDEVASTARNVLIAFGNKTEDWFTCQQIFTLIRPFAVSESLRKQIVDDLHTVEGNTAWKRVWADVKPIASAPSLSTINGFGFAIYGRSDYDSTTASYAATYYFTALFVPLFPIRRYRVIPTGNGYRFLGKLPLRTFDKWHLGIVISLLLIWFFAMAADSSSSSSGTYSPPPRVQPSDNSSRPFNVSIGSSGYSTPNANALALNGEIEANKSRLAALSADFETCQTTLEQYRSSIDSDRQQLDDMQGNSRAGLDIDQSEYESIRRRHNSTVRLYNTQLARCRSLADEHDTLVETTNAKIREYNRLVGAQ